jgi:hypothetical protein
MIEHGKCFLHHSTMAPYITLRFRVYHVSPWNIGLLYTSIRSYYRLVEAKILWILLAEIWVSSNNHLRMSKVDENGSPTENHVNDHPCTFASGCKLPKDL